MAEQIVVPIVLKFADYLLEPTKRQVKYLFRFNKITKDLTKETETLKLSQDRVQNLVEIAKRNAEEIEKDVLKWLKDVDSIIAEVQSLGDEIVANKSCISGWCPTWGSRYCLAKKLTKKTIVISELQKNGLFTSISHPASPPGIELLPSGDFIAFGSTRSAFIQIMMALKDGKTQTIGLHGMGGVGKTTLVKEVGKKAKELKLFDEVAMAVVSQNVKIRDIQGQIADMLGLKFEQESQIGRAGWLCNRLKNEKKILIILDDVWEYLNLGDIGIPFGDGHEGCKIVLTSRRQQVFNSMGIQKKIPLNTITEEEAYALFKKNAGLGDDTPILNDVMARVCRECQRLPIAIVTVGRALQDKNLDEWEVAAQQLRMSKPGNIEGVHNVYECLKLSYDYLPSGDYKFCFLFCCLFPEDYAIDVEDLCRYLVGIGLFRDVNTIEDARREVRTTIKALKDAGLLLNHDGEHFVKMHDVIRDVAIQIASRKKHWSMIRAGFGLTKWPEQESFDHCTAISLMANELCELPNGLKCLKLQTLLIGGNKACVTIPNSFFEEMKGLRILDLSHGRSYGKTNITHQLERPKIQGTLSLPSSLELLTNLRTLNLCDQVLGDLSVLGKLKKLEFLSCRHCEIHELPNELGELSNLRLLDLTDCYALDRIPANVISRLSRLEELYIGGESFRLWEVESTSRERSNASLSELISLRQLTILAVVIEDVARIPEDFHFQNLTRYNIGIGNESGKYPYSNSIQLESIHSPLPGAIKELLPTTEHLSFSFLEEGYHNVIPDIDQEGLEKLRSLELRCCDELECLIDSTQWNQSNAFRDLAELYLYGMESMRVICCGHIPLGFLQKIQIFVATKCRNLCTIFPVMMSPCLEKVEIGHCSKLQEVFPHEEEILIEKEHALLNSTLKEMSLSYLPELQCIWKEPACLLKFRNLHVLKVRECKGLRILFPLPVARTLLQLKILEIRMCEGLEKIIATEDCEVKGSPIIEPVSFPKLESLIVEGCNKMKSLFSITIARSLRRLKELQVCGGLKLDNLFSDDEEAEFLSEELIVGDKDEKAILLPELSYLELRKLPSLISLCSGNYHFIWPCLEELRVEDLPGMTMGAAVALFHKLLSNSKNLQAITVRRCGNLHAVFTAGSLQRSLALRGVTVEECDLVKEIFQLDGTIIEEEHMLLLSKLTTLTLRFLPELRCIWKVPTQYLSLGNLGEVRVHRCNRLKYLFSPTLAESMQQLQSLTIRDCEDLQHIIAENNSEENLAESFYLPSRLFPKMKSLSVMECNKLKSLFPINIAQGLQQLVSLEVSKAFQLKVLFSQENPNDGSYGKQILLPCLRKLLLQELPSLVGLCSGSSHFVFQTMQDFKVDQCDKMKTRFVRDPSNRMHATGKLH